MTQGIFVNGRRPKSKTEIRQILSVSPADVKIEATSVFGNEYSGPATEMPENTTIYFVGPDPYTSRKFYGQLKRKGDKVTAS